MPDVPKRVVILGAGIAGLTAALELRRRLSPIHEVVVVSSSDDLVFAPSLVWVPFGLRDKQAVSRLVRPLLTAAGIGFKQAPVTGIDPSGQRVFTAVGPEAFDYLILATGSLPDGAAVEGLGHTQSILGWANATRARVAWERFVEAPGPVVVGGAPGAAGLDLAYELALAMIAHLRRRGLAERAPLTFLTPEPSPGAIAGAAAAPAIADALARAGATVVTEARIERIEPGSIALAGGERISFAYGMVLPARVGTAAVRACRELEQLEGLVFVDPWGRVGAFPAIFAAGAAIARPRALVDGFGPPTAGYLAEAEATVVAGNIAALIAGGPLRQLPALEQLRDVPPSPAAPIDLAGRGHTWVVPGADARWARETYARLFHVVPDPGKLSRTWTRRHG